MTGALYQFFQIDFAIAKSGFRLSPSGINLFFQLAGILDHAHAATTAPPTGFQHDGISDIFGHSGAFIHIIRQGIGCWHDRHTRLHRHMARRNLVAQRPHHIRRWPDKDQAICGAGFGEIRVFRHKPIARMNKRRP